MQKEWVVCKIFHKSIALAKGSHNINSNAYRIEAPVINPYCQINPNTISTNFNALTPPPNLPSLLPREMDGVNLGHLNQEQQLVQDATQWYNNAFPQLHDNIINSSGAMMNINSLWSF